MYDRVFMLILSAVLIAACGRSGPAPSAPKITAQGFDIAVPTEGLIGEFGDVRLRLEVAGEIDEIRISQGTFSVELAKTLDKDQFRLFGLEQRPYSRSDVTLDLSNYVNERITAAGSYQFDVAVSDHLGQSASASVRLIVLASTEAPRDARDDMVEPGEVAEPEQAAAPVLETGEFVFRRVGPGAVTGADLFGVTWKTIEPIRVTIRLAAAENVANTIRRLSAADFEQARTQTELAELVDRRSADDVIEFGTASNAAAGQVFAVINEDRRFILQTMASETSLSHVGTTVIVTGRYKY